MAFGLLELLLQAQDTHETRRWFNVDKVDLGTAIQCTISRGNKGDRRAPKPITLPEAQSQTGKMKSTRGTIDRNPILCSNFFTHSQLKSRHDRALGEMGTAQNLNNGGYINLSDGLAAVGDE
jgi:hypothetical protein